MREKVLRNLATRTIGSVYKNLEKGGASGLELKYDSLLRGVPGVKKSTVAMEMHGRCRNSGPRWRLGNHA